MAKFVREKCKLTVRLSGLSLFCLSLAAQIVTPQDARPQATIPYITGVASSASGQSVASNAAGHVGAAPGSWITVYGTGFSVLSRAWQDSDFINGHLPPQMDFVSVTVNARPTAISYYSPTQLNILIPPDDNTTGSVAVQVKIQLLQSNFFYIDKVPLQPALFEFTPRYPAAVHNSTGVYAGPAGLLQGVATTPAKPGEVVQLYGTGFGPSNPAAPVGVLFYSAYPLTQAVTATVGGVAASVAAYLVAPGVCQFNITVPNVASGDQPLVLSTGGFSTQSGLFLTVAN